MLGCTSRRRDITAEPQRRAELLRPAARKQRQRAVRAARAHVPTALLARIDEMHVRSSRTTARQQVRRVVERQRSRRASGLDAAALRSRSVSMHCSRRAQLAAIAKVRVHHVLQHRLATDDDVAPGLVVAVPQDLACGRRDGTSGAPGARASSAAAGRARPARSARPLTKSPRCRWKVPSMTQRSRPAMTASMPARSSSSLARTQPALWRSASHSTKGAPRRAASARPVVVLPAPLVPRKAILVGVRGERATGAPYALQAPAPL